LHLCGDHGGQAENEDPFKEKCHFYAILKVKVNKKSLPKINSLPIPKFIPNNYENFLLSAKFARNFVNLRSTIVCPKTFLLRKV
jgi:hypothetical protein